MFDDGISRVFLELRQFSPGDSAQLIVASNRDRRTSRRVGANFLPDDETHYHDRVMAIGLGELGEGILTTVTPYRSGMRELSEELGENQQVDYSWTDEQRDGREAEITGLAITRAFRENFVLETGPMHEPMAVMRDCLDKLLGYWGIDVEAHRSLLRQVRPVEIERWSRELVERYPSNLLQDGEQAVVRIRMNISEVGRPTACTVQLSMSNSQFEELACALLLRHARFEPALDGNGDPIASYWVTQVTYQIN